MKYLLLVKLKFLNTFLTYYRVGNFLFFLFLNFFFFLIIPTSIIFILFKIESLTLAITYLAAINIFVYLMTKPITSFNKIIMNNTTTIKNKQNNLRDNILNITNQKIAQNEKKQLSEILEGTLTNTNTNIKKTKRI